MSDLNDKEQHAKIRAEQYRLDYPPEAVEFKNLLQDYSHIPQEEIDGHIHAIREKAWAVRQYPCIGRWAFMRIQTFTEHPEYEAVLARLKAPDSGDALLDMGCCLGQNIRQLAHAGVDPSRLYAADLFPEFLDIGFELFRDRERLSKATFVAGDVLDGDASTALSRKLDGRITLVHAANFFHLFGWDAQVAIGQRLIRFLKPGTKDALVFGRQIGSLEPGVGRAVVVYTDRRFLHDGESFQKLWDEIGDKTGTRWRVDWQVRAVLPPDIASFMGDAARLTQFAVHQV